MLRDQLYKRKGISGVAREIGKHLRIENLRNYKVTERSNMEDDDPLLCYGIHCVWSPGFIIF